MFLQKVTTHKLSNIRSASIIGFCVRRQLRSCFAMHLHSLGMHAESHLEVVENKGEGRREGSVNFVKFSEIDNTVNSVDLHVELGKHSPHLEKRLALVADGWRR